VFRNVLKGIDRRLSNRFLGHGIGFYPEFKGRRGRSHLKSSASPVAKIIYSDGVYPVENVFDEGFISASRMKLDELEAVHRASAGIIEQDILDAGLKLHVNKATLKLLNAESFFVEITPDYLDVLREKITNWLQVDFDFVTHMLWRNYHTDEPLLFSGDWHFDRRPVNWVRLFVLMEDVDVNQGPFHYLDRASSKKYAKLGFSRRSEHSETVLGKDSRVKLFTGSSGNGAFVDVQRILHKAGVPCEGRTRDMSEIVISIK